VKSRPLTIITDALVAVSSAACGDSGKARNERLAVSCVSGAPVCEQVSMLGLKPDLVNKVKAQLKKQRNDEEENRRTAVTPSTQVTSAGSSQLVAKASIAIIGACTAWQTGMIQRSQIMNTAKELFTKQGYNPGSVDWDRAINVAVELDKRKNLGCLE
jgi:hypothetical protein